MRRSVVLPLLLASVLAGTSAADRTDEVDFTSIEPSPSRPDAEVDWREDYAFSMGVAATHYFYPYLRMANVRWDWTQEPTPHPEVVPNHALNRFWHAQRLVDASWSEGGAPNNDTLYSVAWLYVADEPVILSVPAIDRWFTIQLSGMNSDNFAYVSQRLNGREGGHFALLPQGWRKALPEGVASLAEVPSPWVLVAGRIYVAGEDDVPAVRALQRQFQLVPLSQFGRKRIEPAAPEVFRPGDPEKDPLAVWKTINRTLTENPPQPDEIILSYFFRELNLGPGQDVDALDEHSKRGLARAALEGLRQIQAAQLSGAGKAVALNNGWAYNASLGRAGALGDFLNRTVHQSYSGIVANDPEEAIYLGAYRGSDGQPLDGSKRYRVHMPPGSEPPVDAFWSISLYGDDANFVANEIDRYSIGDRTAGLVRDADGGLRIAIQHDRPTDTGINWLPAPKGPFWLVLRAYEPELEMLEGRWSAPLVEVE